MAFLWSKWTSSSKTNSPANDDGGFPKHTRKQSLSARSRKSLSIIFPTVFDDPSDDKENDTVVDPELNCKEAVHYPIYDPENPDHNTACTSPARQSRSRSWSPLKEQVQKSKRMISSKSPSPTRIMTSSRKALNDFANSLRATAAAMRPSTPPELLRDVSPLGRDSEKSVKSKKSVHWRSSECTTVGTRYEGKTSPRVISKDSFPVLPDFSDSEHFLGSQVALTARPPPTPILTALEKADARPPIIDLQRPLLADITQPPLFSPMPGTNLPLEDPFDDTAAIPDSKITIFEDLDCGFEHSDEPTMPVSDVEVLIGVAPAPLLPWPCLTCSSNVQGPKHLRTLSSLARVHPKPPDIRGIRGLNAKGQKISHEIQNPQVAVPMIQVSSPSEDHASNRRLSFIQGVSDASSSVSLGSALDDSDKENRYRDASLLVAQDKDIEAFKGLQGCRLSSLSESVPHTVSIANSPPRPPPVALLTSARKLPSFHLQANMISTSPARDPTAFRFTNFSDESMSIVDDLEYSWQERQGTLIVKDERPRTPSPANVPLPETPMLGRS